MGTYRAWNRAFVPRSSRCETISSAAWARCSSPNSTAAPAIVSAPRRCWAAIRTHPLFRDIKEPSWLALLVEPCHLLRDVALAERLYPALLPRAHHFFFLGPFGGYFDPPHSRDLGLLCEALGRVDEAVAHLADAESRMHVGPRSHQARVRYELAGVLLARAGPGDGHRAAALLEQARTLAEELDQPSLVLLISARVAESSPHGSHEAKRPAPSGEKDEAPFSLHREGDYWTIAWGVRTLRLRESRGLQMLATTHREPGPGVSRAPTRFAGRRRH